MPRKATRELEESTSDSGSSEAKVAAAPYEELKHVHFIEIPAVKQEKIVISAHPGRQDSCFLPSRHQEEELLIHDPQAILGLCSAARGLRQNLRSGLRQVSLEDNFLQVKRKRAEGKANRSAEVSEPPANPGHSEHRPIQVPRALRLPRDLQLQKVNGAPHPGKIYWTSRRTIRSAG